MRQSIGAWHPADPLSRGTSDAPSGEKKKVQSAGCGNYVPKPFSPRQILAKIYAIPVPSLALIAAVSLSLAQSGHPDAQSMSAFGGKADIGSRPQLLTRTAHQPSVASLLKVTAMSHANAARPVAITEPTDLGKSARWPIGSYSHSGASSDSDSAKHC